MGTPLTYVLSLPPGFSYSEELRKIQYGRCVTYPYAGNDLWFVMIRAGRGLYLHQEVEENAQLGYDPLESELPLNHHTFFVLPKIATPYYFEQLRREVDRWKVIAQAMEVGDWDTRYERLWSDSPEYSHTLHNGTVVKYGYSPTQSSDYPERELWYVILPDHHVFIVDRECTRPDFMDMVGSDFRRWTPICWCHLRSEAYVENHSHDIPFDAPWIPDPNYVHEMDELQEKHRRFDTHRWWEQHLYPGLPQTEDWKRGF